MASEIDICNMALRHLGLGNIVALDPPSTQTIRDCVLFYPQARDTVLRSARWQFATKRRALAAFTVPEIFENLWDYAYVFPADCLQPRAVYVEDESIPQRAKVVRVDTGEKIILTNVENAELEYTMICTDTTWFDVDFVEAVALRLAMYLARPLRADEKKASEARSAYMEAIVQAQTQNHKEDDSPLVGDDPWIAARTVY